MDLKAKKIFTISPFTGIVFPLLIFEQCLTPNRYSVNVIRINEIINMRVVNETQITPHYTLTGPLCVLKYLQTLK